MVSIATGGSRRYVVILFKSLGLGGWERSEVLNKVGDITMGHIIEFLEGKEELEVVSIA